jgi:hypothetical protein
MQPAVSVPVRAALVVVALASGALAIRGDAKPPPLPLQISVQLVTIPIPSITISTPAITRIEDHWLDANRLATVIVERRWGDIEAAAAAIAPDSPYAPWVPAAIGLAVEQLDATAAAYARMNLCNELFEFRSAVRAAWPRGAGAMARQRCGRFICGTAKSEAIKRAGSIAAYRAQKALEDEAYFDDLAAELAREEHDPAVALTTCAEMAFYGKPPAACIVHACRARELAIAEVLMSNSAAISSIGPFITARDACEHVGVTFENGMARADVRQPGDLVRVHPDAPAPL